jgi:hypothetical protein
MRKAQASASIFALNDTAADQNNRSEMTVPDSINLYRVKLGMVGRTGAEQERITAKVAEMVPVFQAHIDAGQLRPLDYHLVEGEGWEAIIAGIADMEAGKLPKKPVVKVQA